MKRIALRADGSSKIGMGHVMRCIALTEMLQGHFKMTFVMYQPDEQVKRIIADHNLEIIEVSEQSNVAYADAFDGVIVDGYWFTEEYIKTIKAKNKKVIQVDDLAGSDFFSDIIINHAFGANYSNSEFHGKHRLLTGPNYAMLRKDFLTKRKHITIREKPLSLTITMGGADPYNYTLKILEAVSRLVTSLREINLIIGTSYSNRTELIEWIKQHPKMCISVYEGLGTSKIIDLFSKTDLLLCSASTIAYEAVAVGVPLGCFMTADNQLNIYEGLISGNYVIGLGDLQVMEEKDLISILQELFLDNYQHAVACVKKQHELIDGLSGKRILKEVLELWN